MADGEIMAEENKKQGQEQNENQAQRKPLIFFYRRQL